MRVTIVREVQETGMGRKIKVGTRKSKLAFVQTEIIINKIKLEAPELSFEIIPISTVGDEILNKPLIEFGGKGVFVDAFETALLEGSIDLAVHSAKDMTMQLPEGLGIIGIPEREDPRDVLVTAGRELEAEPSCVIGTSSLRRQFQIEQFYRAECRSLRGNVQTRLDKLIRGEYDGIILAAAGLKRLKLEEQDQFCYRYFTTGEFVPAAGQGILAVEGRIEDELSGIVSRINDSSTAICLKTERRVLELMNAGCHEAIGVFSYIEKDMIYINGVYKKEDRLIRAQEKGVLTEAADLAARIADRLGSTCGRNR